MKFETAFLRQIFLRASSLVAIGWTQNGRVLDKFGNPDDPFGESNSQWSLDGAVETALFQIYEEFLVTEIEKVHALLSGWEYRQNSTTVEEHLRQWNDSKNRRWELRHVMFEAMKVLGGRGHLRPNVVPSEMITFSQKEVINIIGRGWCREAKARTAAGSEINPLSFDAESWSLLGAIERSVSMVIGGYSCDPPKDRPKAVKSTLEELRRLLRNTIRQTQNGGTASANPVIDLQEWNNQPGRTQDEVLNLLQLVLEKLVDQKAKVSNTGAGLDTLRLSMVQAQTVWVMSVDVIKADGHIGEWVQFHVPQEPIASVKDIISKLKVAFREFGKPKKLQVVSFEIGWNDNQHQALTDWCNKSKIVFELISELTHDDMATVV